MINDNDRVLAVITGPTASGKTGLAIDLARFFNTEIVSADSRQIFMDIPIGTAAPTPAERAAAPHHLVGILPLDGYYSAACFEQDALGILERIWAHNRVAVVCGGSMMYVDALLNGIDDMPTVSDSTRAYVLNLLYNHGLEGVLAQLEILDPEYYSQVDRANTRRVVHAVEISLQAGKPYSSFRTGLKVPRPFKAVKMMIDRPRAELFARIAARVDKMLEDGLEQEAHRAFALGNFNSLNTVGYKEMKAFFDREMTLEQAREKIARNTRVYAKKQLTWLARDRECIRLNPETALPDAIKAVQNLLSRN